MKCSAEILSVLSVCQSLNWMIQNGGRLNVSETIKRQTRNDPCEVID